MAQKNFYAVRGLKEQAIFADWEIAKKEIANVARFGKAPAYKGFVTRAEAENYLLGDDPYGIYQNELKDAAVYYAYTDGSYVKQEGRAVGWGLFIVKDYTMVYGIGGNVDHDYEKHNQIAGEIEAVLAAVRYAIKNKLPNLTIAYDLENIGKWYPDPNSADIVADQNANEKLTQNFQIEIKKLAAEFKALTHHEIKLIKVSAHTKVAFNEKADQLANRARVELKSKKYPATIAPLPVTGEKISIE